MPFQTQHRNTNNEIAIIQLKKLQQHLQYIYEINLDYDIEDFVVCDHRLLGHIDTQLYESQEKLLIEESEEAIDLALYLDPSLVSHLDIDDPIAFLHDGNLNDFWVALEGVSHFLCLTWNASYDKSISTLELDLQAEVDKYIITASLIEQQKQLQCLPYLHTTMFEHSDMYEFFDELSAQQHLEASHFASKYCWALEKYFIHRNPTGLLSELRKFYRLDYQDKIRRIQNFLH